MDFVSAMDVDKVNQHWFDVQHRFDAHGNTPALYDRISVIFPSYQENFTVIKVNYDIDQKYDDITILDTTYSFSSRQQEEVYPL